MRLEITTPTASSDPASLAISPDGQKIVFAGASEGRARLWLRSLDAASARPLAGTDGATFPFWAPDSRSVGFFADGNLKRVDSVSGSVQILAKAPLTRGGAWNREGTILFCPTSTGPVFRLRATGGEPVPVTQLEPPQASHRFPRFLPDESRPHYIRLLRAGIDSGSAEPLKAFPSRESVDIVLRLSGCSSFDPGIPEAEREAARRTAERAFREVESILNPPFGVIDTPREHEIVGSGAWGYGWALDDSGVADVRVSVDGVEAVHPLIHQPHPGVREFHPNYPDSEKSGFGFSLPAVTPGPHTLSVTIIGKDGGVTELKRGIVVR